MKRWSARRFFRFEQFEPRRLLALTTPDLVELAAEGQTYLGSAPVLQRNLVAPTVTSDAQGRPAYDMRTDLPGDQTLRLSSEPSNTDGTRVTRLGINYARVLVDPFSIYEINCYTWFESWRIIIDAYDQSGAFLKSVELGVVDDPDVDSQGGWHRGFMGKVNDRGSTFVELPLQTSLIELRTNSLLTIGFVGDAFDSGPITAQWYNQTAYVTNRPVDLIEADQVIIVEDGKKYSLDAGVQTQGSTTGVTHSVGYMAYDRDGLRIEPAHVERYGTAADTLLAADLKTGDTSIELVNASGWSNESSRPETRSFAWYGYSDSTGKVYADYTYTRNVASAPGYGMWAAGGINGNRITLRQPWAGPNLDAGTAIRNAVAGHALFSVIAKNQSAPISAQVTVGGFWKNGFPDPSAFPTGTATFRPAAELNQALQVTGSTRLSYSVATQAVAPVTTNATNNTRSVIIDVLANDAAATTPIGHLQSVSAPTYGSAQVVSNSPTTRPQVLYTTTSNFIGTDRFSYTYVDQAGQSFTEWVNVASLGGNLNANSALQQAITANQVNLTAIDSIEDFGGASIGGVSGQVITSRPDNLSNLSFLVRDQTTPVSFSLTRGTLHGTLKINADGTLTYQSVPGFVGTDSFEYVISNGWQSTTRICLIGVAANNDEADIWKLRAIALGVHNLESATRRLFYPGGAAVDANGVPLLSWRVHILPHVGHVALYNQFRLSEAWNSPHNLALLNQMPDLFRSTGDNSLSNVTRFQSIQAGQANSPTEHFFNSNGSPRTSQFSKITRGLTNALMVLRAGGDRAVPWTKPDDLRFDNANPLATFGSLTEPYLPVVFADSTTAMMPSDIAASVFTSIASIAPTPGVTGTDGRTLTRAWSERLTPAAEHLQETYVQVTNSLKNIALAMHNYESATRRLPPAANVDANGTQLLSWRVHLLPYLEQAELYSRFRLNEPWNSPHNLPLLDLMPDVFRSAGDSSTTNTTRIRLLNGLGTLYDSGRTGTLNFAQIIDGQSNTIFAVEAGTDKAVPWTAPDALPINADFLSSVGQLPDNLIRMIMVDGSIATLPLTVPNSTFNAMATYSRGEVIARPSDISDRYGPGSPHIVNNLKQIMLGIHNFESASKRLPKNYWGRQEVKLTATPTLSWRVAILPYIDQLPLYLAFHLDEAWDSPHNLSLLPYMPTLYRSQGDVPGSTTTRMQMFSGANTVLPPDFRHVRFSDILDGTSNTLGVVEAGIDKGVPWSKPSDLDGDTLDLWGAMGLVGRSFEAGLMDGSVRSFSKQSLNYLNAMVARNDHGMVNAIVDTTVIAIREGEVAALDVPGNSAGLDPQSFVQMAATSISSKNYFGGFVRLTLRAIPNETRDGPRVTRLMANGRAIDIVVLDGDALSLSLDSPVVSEAGGQVTYTVTRPANNTSSDLTVRLTSSKPLRLPVPESVVIPAGQSSVSFTATAVDNAAVGDAEQVRVTAVASGLVDSSVLVLLADDESLVLTFSPPSIPEFGGFTTATLKRVGDRHVPLMVKLTNMTPSRVSLPEQVIIPAGQTSVDFAIHAIDNAVYDGSANIRILAQGTDYSMGRGGLEVTDFEAIELGLSQVKASEAGEPVTLIVRRTADNQGQAVVVKLRTDRPDKVQIPESVVIPAGLDSINVELHTLDNRLLDGLAHVNISAISASSGVEYTAGQVTLDVADHEALSLTLTPMELSEASGTSRGRLTRSNTDLNRALTVALRTNRSDLVSMPGSVTIPMGFEFVDFVISTIDNDLLTSIQRVTIDAVHSAYLPESLTFDVTDHEPLSLTLSQTSGAEGGMLTATVSRAISNIDQPAVVQLTSSDSSQIGLPNAVTIPANERSVSFVINLLRDQVLDGTRTAQLDATAAGYISATAEIMALDGETVQVALSSTSDIYESDGIVLATLSRSDVNSDFPLTILATSSDPLVASVNGLPLTIAAHQSSITFPITIRDDFDFESTQKTRILFSVQDRALEEVGLDIQVFDDESPWYNAVDPLDVNRDQVVTPLDALLVINYLNTMGSRPTSDLPTPGEPMFVDTSNDQHLSAIDALLVINELNTANARAGAEGESRSATKPTSRPNQYYFMRKVKWSSGDIGILNEEAVDS